MEYVNAIDDEVKEKIFRTQAKKAYAQTVNGLMLEVIDLSIKQETCDERLQRLVQERNSLKRNHKAKVYLDPYHVIGTTKYKYPGVTQSEMALLHNRVLSAFQLSWIKSVEWSYELTKDGYIHFHAWLIPLKPIAPADVKDRLKRSQLKYIIDFSVKGNKFLEVLRRCKPIDYQNTIKYITKNEKKDVDFRKLFSLIDLYTCHTGEGTTDDPDVSLDSSDVECEEQEG